MEFCFPSLDYKCTGQQKEASIWATPREGKAPASHINQEQSSMNTSEMDILQKKMLRGWVIWVQGIGTGRFLWMHAEEG